jgi:hypothetical protein
MDEVGDLWCPHCSFSYFIQDVSFKCSDARHGNDYAKFSCSNFCTAIANSLAAISVSGMSEEQKISFQMNVLLNI